MTTPVGTSITADWRGPHCDGGLDRRRAGSGRICSSAAAIAGEGSSSAPLSSTNLTNEPRGSRYQRRTACRVARPSPRGLKRPLEPLGLTLQIHERGSHTREVVVSAREGLDQPGNPGSRLSEARVQIVDGVAVSRTTTFAPRDPEALDDVTSRSYLQPVLSTSRHPHWRNAGHVFGLALVVFD